MLLLLRYAAAGLVLLLLYLLFAGTVSATELEAGVPLAVATVGLMVLLQRLARRPLSLRAPARAFHRPLTAVVPDAVRVARVLLSPRPREGGLICQPFRRGGCREAGRRALTVIGCSLAPNGIVVRMTRDALIIHYLAPKQPNPDREWPA